MHYLSPLTTKRQRPLKGCARATSLRKCFVDNYMVMYRNVYPQVTNLSFAETNGLLYLDFFNLQPRINTHDYKIKLALFKVWMVLLKKVSGSVLWLMKYNEGAHTNPIQSARDHCLDPGRINFALRLLRVEDHLARYGLAYDLIDTFCNKSHTAVGDALRAGLPVVSLFGGSFASRVAASLLHDVGMPELAGYSFQDYHYKALQLENYEPIRKHYKRQLEAQMNEKVWPPKSKQQSAALEQLLHTIN